MCPYGLHVVGVVRLCMYAYVKALLTAVARRGSCDLVLPLHWSPGTVVTDTYSVIWWLIHNVGASTGMCVDSVTWLPTQQTQPYTCGACIL
jgi:hypothetical protein